MSLNEAIVIAQNSINDISAFYPFPVKDIYGGGYYRGKVALYAVVKQGYLFLFVPEYDHDGGILEGCWVKNDGTYILGGPDVDNTGWYARIDGHIEKVLEVKHDWSKELVIY